MHVHVCLSRLVMKNERQVNMATEADGQLHQVYAMTFAFLGMSALPGISCRRCVHEWRTWRCGRRWNNSTIRMVRNPPEAMQLVP